MKMGEICVQLMFAGKQKKWKKFKKREIFEKKILGCEKFSKSTENMKNS
jgi:hypothetical protein